MNNLIELQPVTDDRVVKSLTTMHPRRSEGEAIQEPSPEEIRRCCEEIQMEWTETERRKRATWKPVPWTVPEAVDHRPAGS